MSSIACIERASVNRHCVQHALLLCMPIDGVSINFGDALSQLRRERGLLHPTIRQLGTTGHDTPATIAVRHSKVCGT